jgi:hypothetical protein
MVKCDAQVYINGLKDEDFYKDERPDILNWIKNPVVRERLSVILDAAFDYQLGADVESAYEEIKTAKKCMIRECIMVIRDSSTGFIVEANTSPPFVEKFVRDHFVWELTKKL